MPDFTPITVTDTYQTAEGTPETGWVTFTPSAPFWHTTTGRAVSLTPREARLDAGGAFSIVLEATDDPTTTPAGVTYTVVEHLGTTQNAPYSVALDHTVSPVVLRRLAPVLDTTLTYGVLTTDSRLSDARPPTGAATGVLAGTYPAPTFAVDMSTQAELDAEASTRAGADSTLTTNVATNTSAISTEATTRAGADTTHAALTGTAHGGIAPTVHAHAHSALTGVAADDHHAQLHAAAHAPGGADDRYRDHGHGSATRVATMDRLQITAQITLTTQTALFTFFTPDVGLTITSLLAAEGGATPSSVTLVRFGLYTVDASNNLTLVARTAADATLLATANAVYTAPLATAGGYPSSYALVRGVRYALALIAVFTGTAPAPRGASIAAAVTGLAPVMSRSWAAQSDLPTSAPFASTGATGNVVWMAAA